MKHGSIAAAAPLAALLLMAACSSGSEETGASASPDAIEVTATPAPSPQATASAVVEADASGRVLGLEGLGDLRIGQPVPANSSWASRGAQESDACSTITSPDFPGANAIVTGGEVRRISVGQRSDVKLVEGIGAGSSEADVKRWFPGFREEPHKYVDAPAKYLTAPNAASGDVAVRFEIGGDGNVSFVHVGTMPELGYVEGCA